MQTVSLLAEVFVTCFLHASHAACSETYQCECEDPRTSGTHIRPLDQQQGIAGPLFRAHILLKSFHPIPRCRSEPASHYLWEDPEDAGVTTKQPAQSSSQVCIDLFRVAEQTRSSRVDSGWTCRECLHHVSQILTQTRSEQTQNNRIESIDPRGSCFCVWAAYVPARARQWRQCQCMAPRSRVAVGSRRQRSDQRAGYPLRYLPS